MAPSGDDLVVKSHSSEGPCVHPPQSFGSWSVLGTTESSLGHTRRVSRGVRRADSGLPPLLRQVVVPRAFRPWVSRTTQVRHPRTSWLRQGYEQQSLGTVFLGRGRISERTDTPDRCSCPSAFPRPCCSPASGPGGATRPGSWRWETGRRDPRQPGLTGAACGPDLRPGHRRRASVRRGPRRARRGVSHRRVGGAPAARRGRPAWDRRPPPGYNGPAGTPRTAHPGGRSQWPGIGTAIIPARCASARRSAGSTWAGARSPGSRPGSTSSGGPSAWPGRWPGVPRRPGVRSPRPTSGSWTGWPT